MDIKLWRENRKENFFGVFLIGWREKKINGGRKWGCLMDKNAHVHLHMTLSVHCSSSPFIYLFLAHFFSFLLSCLLFFFFFFLFFL